MNRGFKTYYKEGRKVAKRMYKTKGNFIRYYIFLFSAILGGIFLPSFYQLANVRMAKNLRQSNQISVSKLFKSGDNPKSLYTMILSFFLSLFIFVGGVLAISSAGGLLLLLASAISFLIFDDFVLIVYIIFLAPVGIGLIIFIVEYFLSLSPRAYIVDTVDNVGASDVLNKSFTSMKKGKFTLFMLNFVPSLIGSAISIGLLSIPTLIYLLLGKINYLFIVLSTVLFIVAIILILFIIPKVHTTINVGALSFFEDVVFDKYNDVFETKGVDIKNINIKKFRVDSIEENLAKLFDETKCREPLKEDEKEKEVFVEKDIIKDVCQEELGNLVDTLTESEDESLKVENISDIQNENQELDSTSEPSEDLDQENLSEELVVQEKDKKDDTLQEELDSLEVNLQKEDESINEVKESEDLDNGNNQNDTSINLVDENQHEDIPQNVIIDEEDNHEEVPLKEEPLDKKEKKLKVFDKIKSLFNKKEKLNNDKNLQKEDESINEVKESEELDNGNNQNDTSIDLVDENQREDIPQNVIIDEEDNHEEVPLKEEEPLDKKEKKLKVFEKIKSLFNKKEKLNNNDKNLQKEDESINEVKESEDLDNGNNQNDTSIDLVDENQHEDIPQNVIIDEEDNHEEAPLKEEEPLEKKEKKLKVFEKIKSLFNKKEKLNNNDDISQNVIIDEEDNHEEVPLKEEPLDKKEKKLKVFDKIKSLFSKKEKLNNDDIPQNVIIDEEDNHEEVPLKEEPPHQEENKEASMEDIEPSIIEEDIKPVSKKTRAKKEVADKEATSEKKTVKKVEKKTVTRKKKEGE